MVKEAVVVRSFFLDFKYATDHTILEHSAIGFAKSYISPFPNVAWIVLALRRRSTCSHPQFCYTCSYSAINQRFRKLLEGRGGGVGGAAFAPWQLMTCILNDATSTHPHLSIAHIWSATPYTLILINSSSLAHTLPEKKPRLDRYYRCSHFSLIFYIWLFSLQDIQRPSKEELFSLRAFIMVLVKQMIIQVGIGTNFSCSPDSSADMH
jgi:hypothetical protein